MLRIALGLSCAFITMNGAPAPIPLWPGTAPGVAEKTASEHDTTTEKEALVAGKRVARITDISVPQMTVYLPRAERKTDAAILVFPGGGYRILAWDLEGTEVCDWLNSIGVTAVLVKYRVPAPPGVSRWAPALQDAQRALGMVRARAAEWGVDPGKIGVLGFSAGAHLSAALSTNYDKRSYERVDAADDLPCRPDFAVLVYPGGLVPRDSSSLSSELKVTSSTPPTFLAQTEDDQVRVENSLAYYAALKAAKVSVEMHLYPTGGHGYGLRRTEHAVTGWPLRVEEWLRTLKVAGKS